MKFIELTGMNYRTVREHYDVCKQFIPTSRKEYINIDAITELEVVHSDTTRSNMQETVATAVIFTDFEKNIMTDYDEWKSVEYVEESPEEIINMIKKGNVIKEGCEKDFITLTSAIKECNSVPVYIRKEDISSIERTSAMNSICTEI